MSARDDDLIAATRRLTGALDDVFVQTARLFRSAADRTAPGLQIGAYRALSAIVREGPIAASTLADRLTVDRAQVSRAVKELQEGDLIDWVTDESDRRSRLLSATSLGRERLAAGRDPMIRQFEAVLDDWAIADIESLSSLLNALTRSADES